MQSFSTRLNLFKNPELYVSWKGIQRGIEREALRVDAKGSLSNKPHPKALGSSLTHPLITTDFSEALIELITEPTAEVSQLFQQLKRLHQFVYRGIGEEYLWASSMPCRLPASDLIPIAEYGNSNIGKLKRLYRVGLGHRYGRLMQTIAGIHYNFSLPQDFWIRYQALTHSELSLSQFISEQYLGMIRNAFRHGWLLAFLLGASPAVSSTFFSDAKIPNFLEPLAFDHETLIAPYATSLRLSDLGYHNKMDMNTFISYNSFSEFLSTLEKAIQTPNIDYKRIGIVQNGQYKQMSDSILQTENEHYALIRPKAKIALGERQLRALKRRGIEYLEIRALDVNPFAPLGIDEQSVRVLDAFLIMCLMDESPPIHPIEMQEILKVHNKIAKEGRRGVEAKEKAKQLLSKMLNVAPILDKAYHSQQWEEACNLMLQRIEKPQSLNSARILEEMCNRQESHLEFTMRWSVIHKNALASELLDINEIDFFEKMAENSHQQQAILEKKKDITFDQYLHQYLKL